MFDRLKLESLCDVNVTRIGGTLSYGFPQTVFYLTKEKWNQGSFVLSVTYFLIVTCKIIWVSENSFDSLRFHLGGNYET